jgi:hypothetical protein
MDEFNRRSKQMDANRVSSATSVSFTAPYQKESVFTCDLPFFCVLCAFVVK